MKLEIDIKPTGTYSAYVAGPFDKALKVLEKKGYKVITLEQNAQLRMQEGKDAYVSRNGNWTREGVIYTPRKKPKLVRNSPILYSAEKATQAHRKGNEFYPSWGQIEQALEDSVDFPSKNIEISTDKFDSEALTVYAFGGENEARKYGEFLKDAGIKRMHVSAVSRDYVNSQNQPFATQMWFWSLDDGSGLDGVGGYWGWVFAYNCRLRGVKMGAEGAAPKFEGNKII